MNLTEKKIVESLKALKEHHAVTAVKMEFEAEGTRLEEAMRLKDLSSRAGLDMTLKIGGCEALTDMFAAATLGVGRLVAPMVETPYAMRKYHGSILKVFAEDERSDVDFLFNLETITGCENFAKMIELPEFGLMSGIVLGRTDLTGSLGMERTEVNSERIYEICSDMAAKAKSKGKTVVVGGSVSAKSLPFFRRFPQGHLDRYETRKVVFTCPAALANTAKAFVKALEFEILWLKNKQNYYGRISKEDGARIAYMEARYKEEAPQAH